MGIEDFGLALEDIKNCISPRSLSYLTSVLEGREEFKSVGGVSESGSGSQGTLGGRRGGHGHRHGHSSSSSSNWTSNASSGPSSRGIHTFPSSSNFSGGLISDEGGSGFGLLSEDLVSVSDKEDAGTSYRDKHFVPCAPVPQPEEPALTQDIRTRRRDLLNMSVSSSEEPPGISPGPSPAPKNDGLFPICHKILARVSPLPRPASNLRQDFDVKSVSELVEREKPHVPEKHQASPYLELIGKIAETKIQKDFARTPLPVLLPFYSEQREDDDMGKGKESGRRKKKKKAYDFSSPITNPLYKSYDPRGHQKTEEEVASESIQEIGKELNEWIGSLGGDAVQLDINHLTNILRRELQLPETILLPRSVSPTSQLSSRRTELTGHAKGF